MAASKVSDLTALTGAGAATGDLFLITDVSATTAGSKKMTAAELMAVYPVVITTALAGSGMHATEDKVPIYDNGVPKTALVTELLIGAVALSTAIDTGYHATQDFIPYIDNGAAAKITIPNLVEAAFILTSTELAGSGVVGGDQLLIGDGTAGSAVPKYITITGLTTAIASLGFTLADIPEYADQAAAATGLTGTGRLWRQTSTGLLGVTIT